MNGNSPHPQVEALFEKAIKLASQAERDAFLDGASGGDAELLDRVERLLIAHEKAGGFMNSQTLTEVPFDTKFTEKQGSIIGRYKLLQQIGEGGMGVVYLAEQTQPITRKVALKIIKLGMDTKQVVARFEVERQALAMMDHPNIAKVLDAGSTDTGRPYFVMELVRGVPITEYCDNNKLANQDRLELFIHVCQAIQHAHQKGVIHRDIKPSNVLVTLHDGDAVPKVIDFGIAKATNQKLTEKTLFTNYSHMIGTPAYMSPEQAEMNGLDVDTRTDVYSLGVLLYELLTGSTPFAAKDLLSRGYGEIQRIIAEQEPAKPSRLLSTMQNAEGERVAKNRGVEFGVLRKVFQGDLDWIVMKALEKDRARRYDTANGLAADILRFRENEPIIARPPTPFYRFQKAWRRNKVMYTAGALVVVSLLLGTIVSSQGLTRAVEQKRLADENAKEAQEEKARAELTVEQLNHNLYRSLIAQADRELVAERHSNALELLEQCPKELIHWEWHYLRNRCHGTAHASLQIPEPIRRMIVSPSGRDFVTIGDKHLKLWKASSGGGIEPHSEFKPLTSFGQVHGAVRFSRNGGLLSTLAAPLAKSAGGEDSRASGWILQLWDVASGTLYQSLEKTGSKIVSVAFHPNGEELASVSENDVVRIWDTKTCSLKRMFTLEHPGTYTLVYSPDGKWLAAGGWFVIRLIETETWTKQSETTPVRNPIEHTMVFHPDNQSLLSVDNIRIQVSGNPTGIGIGTLEGHGSWVQGLSFSADGKRLFSCGKDRKVKVWDWENQRELLTLEGHGDSIDDLVLTADQQIVTGDQNGEVIFWDGGAGGNLIDDQITSLDRHSNTIRALQFLKDGRLLSSGEDGNAFIWDLDRNVPLKVLKGSFGVGVSADQNYLFTDAPTWDDLGVGDAYTPPDTYTLRVYETQNLTERFAGANPLGRAYFSAAISPDGRHVVGGEYGGPEGSAYLHIWDWQHETEPIRLGLPHLNIGDIKFSADGRFLATIAEHGMISVFDATDLSEASKARILWPQSGYRDNPHISFHPDCRRLAAGDGGNDVIVLDVEKGGAPLLRLSGHGDAVVCVAYSPDGKYLASAGIDRAVCVWDSETGEFLHRYLGHTSVIHALSFSWDGHLLASGGEDKSIRLWRLDVLPRG